MSEKIQFIIEMPIPKYLQGSPYDEIEGEFRRQILSATRSGLIEQIDLWLQELKLLEVRFKENREENEWVFEYAERQLSMIRDWSEIFNRTKVLCSR